MFGGVGALLGRELKGQVRSRRAPATLTIYLALMVVVLLGSLLVSGAASDYGASASSGQTLFIILAMTQTALILLLGPVFAAGALAGERERQTFDTLVSTRMSSAGIVFGKVSAAVVFMVLLATSSLPLMALAYVYGGVGPGTLFAVYAWDVLLIVWVTALATACSSLVGRTIWAAVVTYVLVFLSVFMTGFLEVVLQALRSSGGADQPSLFFLYLNPFAGLWELAIPGAREEIADAARFGSFVVWGGLWHAVVSAVSLGLAVWAASPLRRLSGRRRSLPTGP